MVQSAEVFPENVVDFAVLSYILGKIAHAVIARCELKSPQARA